MKKMREALWGKIREIKRVYRHLLGNLRGSNMEFPTQELLFGSLDEFDNAAPQDPGEFGMELMAQIRNNGRILDHHRIVLGGDKMQTLLVPMRKMYPLPALHNYKYKFQFWPRDAAIRRNMCTSIWVDAANIIATKEAVVVDEASNAVAQETVLGQLAEAEVAASVRWAVVIGEDQRMRLHLQSLPASAVNLSGKPAFRG